MRRLSLYIDRQIIGEQVLTKKQEGQESTKQIFTNICWAGGSLGGSNQYADELAAVNNKGCIYLYNTTKLQSVKTITPSNAVLNTCAIETNENGLLAAAGYDGRIYLTNINTSQSADTKRDNNEDQTTKFTGHQGVVNCLKFLNYNFMLSGKN